MSRNERTGYPQWSRREWLRVSSAAGAAGFASAIPSRAAPTLPVRGGGPDVYTRIGARPFINCTATLTLNGGTATLPEVIEATREASYYHVNLDELMAKVGPRIAELLGSEAAMVSSGAAGANTCGTLACVAGGDPEKIQQLPDTRGLKDEVIVPKWARSIYDQAIRTVGIKMIEVDTLEDLERAFGPKTAMATSTTRILNGKFSAAQYVDAAHKRGVPVLIDAAAELPLVPNPFLADGVDLVSYSGGKILRGPQSAGLLLGRKDLIAAAWTNSAPHHTFARAMKVSKEEIVGILAAVEALRGSRDRAAEDAEWKSWYRHIIERISTVPGVSGRIIESPRPSYYPTMEVMWDPGRIGLIAPEVGQALLEGEPRIMTHAVRREYSPQYSPEEEGHSFRIRPAAMHPGEHKIVAERLLQVFRNAPGPKSPLKPDPPAVDINGAWSLDIRFVVGSTRHKLYLRSKGSDLAGVHVRSIASGPLTGTLSGDMIRFRSEGPYEAATLAYSFSGRVHGNEMSGEVNLGEYGKAEWRAYRKVTAKA